jgi:hypothetical protein
VTVYVDSKNSASGAFSLDIQPETADCAPDGTLPLYTSLQVPAGSGSGSDLLSGSCVSSRLEGMWNSEDRPAPEHHYALSVNYSPGAGCGYAFSGDLDFAVYLLGGDHCKGAEALCQVATFDGTDYKTSVSQTSSDNGEYVLVVENRSNLDPLNYTVALYCI